MSNLINVNGAFLTKKGLRVNTDGTDIRDRKPHLKLCSNHFKKLLTVKRRWVSDKKGTAKRDGCGWYV